MVSYLVVMVGRAFIPATIDVPAGSTVYWVRLNGALSQYDNGDHNVVFTNGMVSSPILQQWATYSFTFGTAGTFPYTCPLHDGMDGTVVVG